MHVREATVDDAAAISAIYAAEVVGGWATFDLVPPPDSLWAEAAQDAQEGHHLLAAVDDGAVLGFARSGTFRPRPAYRTTVETSIYLARRGTGVGTALYGALLRRLDAGPCHRAVAHVALPNEASMRLHQGTGFTPVGTLHEVGYKLGAWRDVACFQRRLDGH